jgi:hypothetical protein
MGMTLRDTVSGRAPEKWSGYNRKKSIIEAAALVQQVVEKEVLLRLSKGSKGCFSTTC